MKDPNPPTSGDRGADPNVAESEVVLVGGRANVGRVVRIGGQVARPTYPQTETVEHFLRFLLDQGVRFVPEPLGQDERGRQRLRYLPGEAPTPPYPDWAFDERLLADVAGHQLLLHQLAGEYIAPADAVWAVSAGDYFPPEALRNEQPIVCHNDLGMPNIIVDGTRSVVGIVDFDYCRPVDRLFDIAVAVRHWAPFGDLDLGDGSERDGTVDSATIDRLGRFRIFCDVHGLTSQDRRRVIVLAMAFLEHARRNIEALAAAGNQGFRTLLDNGYRSTNLATLAWLDANTDALVAS